MSSHSRRQKHTVLRSTNVCLHTNCGTSNTVGAGRRNPGLCRPAHLTEVPRHRRLWAGQVQKSHGMIFETPRTGRQVFVRVNHNRVVPVGAFACLEACECPKSNGMKCHCMSMQQDALVMEMGHLPPNPLLLPSPFPSFPPLPSSTHTMMVWER